MSNIIPFTGVLKSRAKVGNQGGNQGGNQVFKVPTLVNYKEELKIEESTLWISVKEAGNLIGITDRAIKKNCKGKKYVTQFVQGNGGMQYRIALSSLPIDAQMRWRKEHGFMPEKVEESKAKTCKPFDEMSEQQRQKALDRYDLVTAYQKAIAKAQHGKILDAKESFIARYAAGEWPVLLERLGVTTWKTIDLWIKTLRANKGQPSCLAPNYRYTREGSAVVGISMEQGELIAGGNGS